MANKHWFSGSILILCVSLLFFGTVSAQSNISVWLSTQDGSKLLNSEKSIIFEGKTSDDIPVIEVNPAVTYQSILGLGSSWEHATCENLYKLPEEDRNAVIKKVVHPTEGIGMNLMRICIGSSDFIGEEYYTYCDLPEGETDEALEHFSIEKDRAYLIPVLKKSLEYNPDLLFLASPWSPPAWMKTSGKLGGGKLKPEYYNTWARYLPKYIQAYEAEGIPIHAITVQNEPNMIHMDYPTTLWNGEMQRDFIRDHLGPLFKDNGIKTLIWCWDHNWNNLDFPRAILSDPKAAQYVDGTGFHLYEGKVEAQSELKTEFQDKHIYFTEGSVFRTTGAIRIMDILRNWSRTYSAWVTMLDEHRKPNHGPHSASATTIELKDDLSVEYRYDFYMYGHFMKFIERNAVRIDSNVPDIRNFANVAFKNPDGSIVLIAANAGRKEVAFAVSCSEASFPYTLPASSIATFIWKP